ncbi:lipopolysaccharide core biosynthesis protein rfaS [Flavobacterium sp. xlx-214]|uniref:lipopolysaccharide core biosynthesis protein rfaS n=1 Tax=unclassified Flavobacterium TaxID=196869 RepID=UPI0013D807F7|nr:MULTISPECIES: lipopolysaccharide core biosynthesis protein rfaS [unclassified Flavobacterium]MBA5791193.1 lipopolysaccharide core biosynthesis protein rfaS [Flavobacterium sp. xlx-221]QMI83637.1 lipopolysaccharide core biosynthesis protein rfaS [Flavobacterium sp. xlx-214]
MKQNLLFFAPNHFDIDLVILNQLKETDQYNVVKIDPKSYQYKNRFEQVLNLLGKVFLKKTFKKDWKAKQQLNHINQYTNYDVCLIFRPDLLHTSVLKFIQANVKSRKVVYWDSFDKIPKLKETVTYFNEYYSFEEDDCSKYNFTKISNFYIHKSSDALPVHDAFFFGSKDARLNNVIKIITYLKEKNWNAKALIVAKKTKSKSKPITAEGVKITETSTPFSQIYKYSENTKIVIDIAHPNQKGLSMRPYECVGLERKLITNNAEIKKYDFFNQNNIFIIDNFDNLNIPDSFLSIPYQKLPEHIYKKYHISNWLNFILN